MKILDLRGCPKMIPRLAEWHQAEWARFNPGETLAQRIRRMQLYLGCGLLPSTWVAFEGDELLGSAAMVACDLETYPQYSPWLASLYVRREHRGRGIGTSLIHHVLEQSRNAGFGGCYLFTGETAAEQLYRRLGWEVVERDIHCGEEVAIMKYSLG